MFLSENGGVTSPMLLLGLQYNNLRGMSLEMVLKSSSFSVWPFPPTKLHKRRGMSTVILNVMILENFIYQDHNQMCVK